MNRAEAERIISGQAKSVFGFALRRCASIQDAEDMAQEIALRGFKALISREDMTDPVRYLWMVAHNVLANHYRARSRVFIGIPDTQVSETDLESVYVDQDAACRLRQEIAYLSRTQREIIVAYYFHGRRQAEIAQAMKLPLGTVKWHLFEAKKELKKNMEHPRGINHLSFDPIRFTSFSVSGSIGTEGSPWRLFRSTLAQNIARACWKSHRSLTDIAQALGVSPVYVEDLVQQMTQQGYLLQKNDRYLCAILLTEITDDLTQLSDRMYQEAAMLIAPELVRALRYSDIWTDEALICRNQDAALWALVPWCIANHQEVQRISRSEIATPRPDGALNFCTAAFSAPGAAVPAMQKRMDGQFSGPCWNESNGITLWQLDSMWSEHHIDEVYQDITQPLLVLLRHFMNDDPLLPEEYAQLARYGLIHTQGDPQALFQADLLPVWLKGQAICEKLMLIADNAYARHHDTLEALKKPFADALLADTPPHLRKLREFTLQELYSAHWFIVYCLDTLINMQLLPTPTDEMRSALHTMIITD